MSSSHFQNHLRLVEDFNSDGFGVFEGFYSLSRACEKYSSSEWRKHLQGICDQYPHIKITTTQRQNESGNLSDSRGLNAYQQAVKKTSFDRDEIKSLCPVLNKHTRTAMEVDSMQQVLEYQTLKRSMGDSFPRTLIVWTRVKELRTNGKGIGIPATTEDFLDVFIRSLDSEPAKVFKAMNDNTMSRLRQGDIETALDAVQHAQTMQLPENQHLINQGQREANERTLRQRIPGQTAFYIRIRCPTGNVAQVNKQAVLLTEIISKFGTTSSLNSRFSNDNGYYIYVYKFDEEKDARRIERMLRDHYADCTIDNHTEYLSLEKLKSKFPNEFGECETPEAFAKVMFKRALQFIHDTFPDRADTFGVQYDPSGVTETLDADKMTMVKRVPQSTPFGLPTLQDLSSAPESIALAYTKMIGMYFEDKDKQRQIEDKDKQRQMEDKDKQRQYELERLRIESDANVNIEQERTRQMELKRSVSRGPDDEPPPKYSKHELLSEIRGGGEWNGIVYPAHQICDQWKPKSAPRAKNFIAFKGSLCPLCGQTLDSSLTRVNRHLQHSCTNNPEGVACMARWVFNV